MWNPVEIFVQVDHGSGGEGNGMWWGLDGAGAWEVSLYFQLLSSLRDSN